MISGRKIVLFVKLILNTKMIFGAVLGVVMFVSLSRIQTTFRHQGSGRINYEEHSEWVTEEEFKRVNYSNAGMMLFIAISIWLVVALPAYKGTTFR